MTTSTTSTMQQFSFGTHIYNFAELSELSRATFAAKTLAGSSDKAHERAVWDEMRREFGSGASTCGVLSGVAALWHWFGGVPAGIADIICVHEWLQQPIIRKVILEVMGEGVKPLPQPSEFVWTISLAARGEIEMSVPANQLAEALERIVNAASEYVGFDGATNEWSDPYELLPVIDLWVALTLFLREGPDDDGRYLPDEMVYGGFAGPAPQQV